MDAKMEGKVGIITGAGHGMGAAHAVALGIGLHVVGQAQEKHLTESRGSYA
jgi:NAD(P)-dependent dehydrogenase (short-subunit alcohol dehydrogenase family)